MEVDGKFRGEFKIGSNGILFTGFLKRIVLSIKNFKIKSKIRNFKKRLLYTLGSNVLSLDVFM